MRWFALLLIGIVEVNCQFGEIASLATSLLGLSGPAVSGGLGAASLGGSAAGAGSQALSAISQIGQLYQLAQGALQLTGTGVQVLNKASEGSWFPAMIEATAKNNERLGIGNQNGGLNGMSGLGGLGSFGNLKPQPSGTEIGPEFGTDLTNAGNGEGGDLEPIDASTTTEEPLSTLPPDPFTTLPTETEKVTLFPTDYETLEKENEINIELPEGTNGVETDYEHIITEGEKSVRIGTNLDRDEDENLLEKASARRTRANHVEQAVPNLERLIEVLQKSHLSKDEIKDIVNQVSGNAVTDRSSSNIDLYSSVRNISPSQYENRQRILEASRALNKNNGEVHPRFLPEVNSRRQREISSMSFEKELHRITLKPRPMTTMAPPVTAFPLLATLSPTLPTPPTLPPQTYQQYQQYQQGQWWNGRWYPYYQYQQPQQQYQQQQWQPQPQYLGFAQPQQHQQYQWNTQATQQFPQLFPNQLNYQYPVQYAANTQQVTQKTAIQPNTLQNGVKREIVATTAKVSLHTDQKPLNQFSSQVLATNQQQLSSKPLVQITKTVHSVTKIPSVNSLNATPPNTVQRSTNKNSKSAINVHLVDSGSNKKRNTVQRSTSRRQTNSKNEMRRHRSPSPVQSEKKAMSMGIADSPQPSAGIRDPRIPRIPRNIPHRIVQLAASNRVIQTQVPPARIKVKF